MEKTERTVSELASLFRMLQVIPEADNVNKVYQVLLAFCTTWKTIGFERAFLLLVDSHGGVIRGHLATEQAHGAADADAKAAESFESLAKRVFDNYEQIDSSDLTLKTRTFAVPIDWHRSAVVKAALSGYSVLAEKRMSEFSTDPFFDFFGSICYIAVPVKVAGSVSAILAADNGQSRKPINIEDVSLVYSLAQQAALAVERLYESSDAKRKFRILRKLQDMLSTAQTPEALAEGLNLGMSMVCRAVGGSGCFLKDLVRQKTTHIKTVDEYSVEADDHDVSVGECFEEILDRTAGAMKPMHGDRNHALLNEVASETIRYFYATPLAFVGEGLGAMAVYAQNPVGGATAHAGRDRPGRDRLDPRNRMFFDLCAGLVAERLSILHKSRLVERADTMLDEVQSNLVRERDSARVGQRAIEYNARIVEKLGSIRQAVYSRQSYEKRVSRARDLLEALDAEVESYQRDLDAIQSALHMVELFPLVASAVAQWKPRVEEMDVEVDVRIPSDGPSLLMNEGSVETALQNILSTLAGCVTAGDRVLVECSVSDERAVVCIADTGKGLPGHLLSRLFMPFSTMNHDDDPRGAMSLAGDILHKHAGEIMVKSSPSWKTILLITFPIAANRDRRRKRTDRRYRRGDRRTPETSTR
jgi:signal transduction histidine kinase